MTEQFSPEERAALSPYLDRKSTRLNSSHGYISYAVFCLKKKKKMDLPCAQTKNKNQVSTEASCDSNISINIITCQSIIVCNLTPHNSQEHKQYKSRSLI